MCETRDARWARRYSLLAELVPCGITVRIEMAGPQLRPELSASTIEVRHEFTGRGGGAVVSLAQ